MDIINLFEQSIDEAYIGKTEILSQVEHQFSILKDKLKMGSDMSASPDIQKLNRLVEQQFGMDIFSLRIMPKSELDANTMTIAKRFDIILDTDMSKLVTGNMTDGYKFKANNNLCVVVNISYGLIKSELSSEELTAILLHEIGHNFADCIDNKIRIENKRFVRAFYEYLILKASIAFGRKHRKALDSLSNNYEREKSKKLAKKNVVRGWLKGLASLKYNFVNFCKGVIHQLQSKKIKAGELDPAYLKGNEAFQSNIVRKNEVFADKFTAIYGYSVEMSKGLYKSDIHKSAADKFMTNLFGEDFAMNYEKLCQYYFLSDPHPHKVQRINTMMNTLKSELEKEDLDPKVKQVIKSQLNQLEEFVTNITTSYKNESERQAVRKAFYKAVNENSPDALTKELEDEIERELDEAIKKN